MIEVILRNLLKDKLGVPLSLEKTKDTKRFVVFEKTGSTLENHLKSSTFAFQSYAESMVEAAYLNERVKEELLAINDKNIVSVSINTDYNYTDTETKEYRYQAVVVVRHY